MTSGRGGPARHRFLILLPGEVHSAAPGRETGISEPEVGVERRGPGDQGAAAANQVGPPAVQGLAERLDAAGGAYPVGEIGDVGQAVAAAAQLFGHPGVADVGGAVEAVAGRSVALRANDSRAFPGAQRRGHHAQPTGDVADEQRGSGAVVDLGAEARQCRPDQPEGLPIARELRVGVAEQRERSVEIVAVHGTQERTRAGVPASGDQCEERIQRQAVARAVHPVARPGAPGRREDALLLVVADRLGGEPVRSGEVDGA